jgi:hypothetical protein
MKVASRRPPEWPEKIEYPRLIAALEEPSTFAPNPAEAEAFAVAKSVPAELRTALLVELKHGNLLDTVDCADWPNLGSVFICLRNKFHPSTRDLSPEVKWVSAYDPHYWREALSQLQDGVEHLIVC